MRVMAILNGYTGALCLQELVDQGYEVVAVVTSPSDPDPARPPAASVKLTADRNYLPVYQPPMQDVNRPEFVELLRRLSPDLLVTMHFPVIFKKELLQVPRLGCVNMHPSRLPAGRGMTPPFWHMLIGDEKNWITLFYLDPGIDTGDVISQGWVDIGPDETGFANSCKLSEEGRRIFAEALPLIKTGKAPRVPQKQIEGVKSSYYSWKPYYARIPWDKPAEQVALHVRALSRPLELRDKRLTSWVEGTYTSLAGRKIYIWECKVLGAESTGPVSARPGEIMAVYGEGLLVQTGGGVILITDANIEGARQGGWAGLVELMKPGVPFVLG